MREIFANVGRHRLANQRAAFAQVRRLARRGVIGWAEIGEADGAIDEAELLRSSFRRALGWRIGAGRTHVPIVMRSLVWRVEDVSIAVAMSGIPRVSPTRHIVTTRLRHRLNGRKRARVNTHTVAGAFNDKQQRHEAERRTGWESHWSLLVDTVARLVADGYDTTVSGDFNRQGKFPALHRRAVLAHKHATDRIYAVPAAGHGVRVARVGSQRLGVDFHRVIWADIAYPVEAKRDE